MVIKNFDDFLNEAKKDKSSLIDLLISLFKENPSIKMDKYPDEKYAYSISGMKRFFKQHGKTSADADEALYQLQNDKSNKIKSFATKNSVYNEIDPYFYMDLSEDKIKSLKEKYEKESAEMAKPQIEKNKMLKKQAAATAKSKEDRKARKNPAAKKAASKRVTAKKAAPKKAAPKKEDK